MELSKRSAADIFQSAKSICENHGIKGRQTFQTGPVTVHSLTYLSGFDFLKELQSYQQSGGLGYKCTSYV